MVCYEGPTKSAYDVRDFLNIASATLNSLSTNWYFLQQSTNSFYYKDTDHDAAKKKSK